VTVSETPPAGYLEVAGQTVSRGDYPNLFSVLGVKYGIGDGVTTFGLPDLRGEFLRGWDNGRNVDINRTLGSDQSDELESHTHPIRLNATDGNAGAMAPYSSRAEYSYTNTDDILGYGGSETRPRNVSVMYCIKY
jgi:microcystin-dependent protein